MPAASSAAPDDMHMTRTSTWPLRVMPSGVIGIQVLRSIRHEPALTSGEIGSGGIQPATRWPCGLVESATPGPEPGAAPAFAGQADHRRRVRAAAGVDGARSWARRCAQACTMAPVGCGSRRPRLAVALRASGPASSSGPMATSWSRARITLGRFRRESGRVPPCQRCSPARAWSFPTTGSDLWIELVIAFVASVLGPYWASRAWVGKRISRPGRTGVPAPGDRG
jgi:hypothetical protein